MLSVATIIIAKVYFFATAATAIKTFAWWLNQWPSIHKLNFFAKWAISASVAGFEYLPMTFAFTLASVNNVHLGLMTAYMEAMDNFLRMIQQLALSKPLAWFDWVAAAGLALFVVYQGVMHYVDDKHAKATAVFQSVNEDGDDMDDDDDDNLPLAKTSAPPSSSSASSPSRAVFMWGLDKERFIILVVAGLVLTIGSPVLALTGGYTGQAYTLATLATGFKTFAWWLNQYPQLKHLSFVKKWLAGWSIAAVLEYLPLIGAMTIASDHNVHLGLLTAYMEALDNFFRVLQQRMLNKPLSKHDYIAAAGMFACVIFQGIMRFEKDK